MGGSVVKFSDLFAPQMDAIELSLLNYLFLNIFCAGKRYYGAIFRFALCSYLTKLNAESESANMNRTIAEHTTTLFIICFRSMLEPLLPVISPTRRFRHSDASRA
jgi:hypothetical protein